MLEIRNLGKTYGTGANATHAVGNVTFSIEEGEFLCVVGPSGCGKTTLLKCVAGLLRPSSGEVVLRGSRVTEPPDQMALVFQEYSRSLMPWLSVRNNVLLPLRHKQLSKRERDSLVEESLGAVGLVRFMDRYPWQLSGGMQQRVAIARAFVFDPGVLLMDEPFSALDELNRDQQRLELLRFWQSNRKAVLFVTHSVPEAVVLSDRIVVMSSHPGRIRRVIDVDLPRPRSRDIYEHPEFHKVEREVFSLLRDFATETHA
jgi:NitT/TauT family transport system ATP-binding protein